MNDKPLILVCDDVPDIAQGWRDTLAARVGDRYDVQPLEDLGGTINLLEQRRRGARGDLSDAWPEDSCQLDSAAIVLVDYDLAKLRGNPYWTGERVCYLARCFSECGVIVGLNQLGLRNPFDLTMIKDLPSFADINIGGDQLANPGLWGEKPPGFRPWIWPVLDDLLARMKERIAQARAHLDEPVLASIGLNRTMSDLPRLIRQALEGPEPGRQRTLRELVEEAVIGLRPGDQVRDDDARARLVAGRLSKWLDAALLRSQDVLLDAPHLVATNPALLANDASDPTSWEQVCDLVMDPTGALHEVATRNRHLNDVWFDRVVYDRDALAADADTPDPWAVEHPDLVFCEDVSSFLLREQTRGYSVEFSITVPTRYVVDPHNREVVERFPEPPPSGVTYRPASNLSA